MKSKRNSVKQVGNTIIKTYRLGDIAHEVMIYRMLQQANVAHAKVLAVSLNQLQLEYLSGATLLEILIDAEAKQISFIPYLNQWFAYMLEFYKATVSYRHGDVHLSNFIVHHNQVIGLDFEQAIQQEPVKDIADCMVYLLFYNPILTSYKKETVATWFAQLPIRKQISDDEWYSELEEALHRLNLRRQSSYSVDWDFLFD